LTFVLGFSGFLSGCSEEVVPIVRFDEVNSAVPLVESTLYNRVLTWRPADRTTVNSNPPRFSWPYEPDIIPEGESSSLPVRKFAFQISEDSDFQKILLDIKATDFNFYNTIPKLPVGKELFWKIGYYPPNRGGPPEWQGVRRFRIEPGTLTWARDRLAIPDLTRDNHPRIIFKKERMNELRALVGRDAFSREIYGKVLADATADLNADWFLKFPASDLVPEKQLREIYSDIPPWLDPDGGDAPYLQMADRLISMAFAYMLSGDERFLEVVERLVTVASWGRTGETRPEGVEGGGSPDNVSLIEYLSLFYDWFYDELSPAQRATVLEGLRWRVEHIVNNYSWRQGVGSKVYPYSISIAGSSHPYENINYTFPAGLAAYEEGGVFKTTYDLAVNFLSGVNNCFGPEDAWNEGPGYGLSKFKWMVNATCYYDMTLENSGFGLNPFLSEIGEFFNRVAVLGLPHLSFGNVGVMEPYYLNNRVSSFRKLAHLTSNKRFLESWRGALKRLEEIGYSQHRKYSRSWIEYALPHFYEAPQKENETPVGRLFPDGGWVAASTHYPGDLSHYQDSLGIVFHARPRGAYNHAFFGDNSFQIYAFGENITHGGGSTRNGDRHAHHSMSQNIVLVDGLGQAQPSPSRMENFKKRLFRPFAARISRFGGKDKTWYWKGEAAGAYVQFPFHYSEFWGHLGDGEANPYDERDLSYLIRADRHVLFVDGRYFVMLDDLEVSESKPEGSLFSWLYHVLQDVPLIWNPDLQRFEYSVGDVTTIVQHIRRDVALNYDNRLNELGLINPITGEDYNRWVRSIQRFDNNFTGEYPDKVTHNVWLTNLEPRRNMRFLVVIYPFRKGSGTPVITRIDDLTVEVSCGSKSETVTFDPAAHSEAEIQVDL